MNNDPDELNRLIARKGDDVIALLEAMEDFRIEDEHGCTPMAAAIRSGNLDALRVMLRSREALEYFPPLDKELRRLVSQQADLMGGAIDETEDHIGAAIGGLRNFERTPLLEACRYGNREAIGLLVEAGAKTGATDAMKKTAPSLCLHQGTELTEFFLDCCIAHRARFPVDDELLGDLCAHPPLYEKAVRHGKLSKRAQHFRFCVACALVDVDGVTALLDAGYDLTGKRPYEYDPLLQATCSDLLRIWNHPAKLELAAPLVRSLEDPKADVALASEPRAAIEAELAASPSEPADDPLGGAVEAALPKDINPVLASDDLVERRLALLDRLTDRGLNTAHAEPRDPFPLLDYLIYANQPRLLERLQTLGLRFHPAAIENHDSVQTAVQHRCFRMVAPLVALGCPVPEVTPLWDRPHREYDAWCRVRDVPSVWADGAGAPASDADTASAGSTGIEVIPGFRAILRSPHAWETVGESLLQAALLPLDSGQKAIVRLTYGNVLGPVDDVRLDVRVGDPADPTDEDGFGARADWQQAVLMEEILEKEGEPEPRDDGDEPEAEGPWHATFEAQLAIPAGPYSIEIGVLSPQEGVDAPVVISDWVP